MDNVLLDHMHNWLNHYILQNFYLIQAIRSDGGNKYCSITDEDGNTLLHLASLYGQEKHAREIIQVQSNIRIEWLMFNIQFLNILRCPRL